MVREPSQGPTACKVTQHLLRRRIARDPRTQKYGTCVLAAARIPRAYPACLPS